MVHLVETKAVDGKCIFGQVGIFILYYPFQLLSTLQSVDNECGRVHR